MQYKNILSRGLGTAGHTKILVRLRLPSGVNVNALGNEASTQVRAILSEQAISLIKKS